MSNCKPDIGYVTDPCLQAIFPNRDISHFKWYLSPEDHLLTSTQDEIFVNTFQLQNREVKNNMAVEGHLIDFMYISSPSPVRVSESPTFGRSSVGPGADKVVPSFMFFWKIWQNCILWRTQNLAKLYVGAHPCRVAPLAVQEVLDSPLTTDMRTKCYQPNFPADQRLTMVYEIC